MFERSLVVGSAPGLTGVGTPLAVSLVLAFPCKLSSLSTVVAGHSTFRATAFSYMSFLSTSKASCGVITASS